MTLAVIRLAGSERVQLVGVLGGGRRPRQTAGEDDEPVEVAPDDRPVAATDVVTALEREELESVTLEYPAELVRLEGITEGAVAGAAGYITHYLVSMLPYGHQVVYLDGVVGLALLPLEPVDGDEADGVVVSYQAARRHQPQGGEPRGKERRRIHLT